MTPTELEQLRAKIVATQKRDSHVEKGVLYSLHTKVLLTELDHTRDALAECIREQTSRVAAASATPATGNDSSRPESPRKRAAFLHA